MNRHKIIPILLVFLFSLISLNGYTQNSTSIIRKDNNSYEVFCEIIFPNNSGDKLFEFCWNMNSIVRILEDEPVTIVFSEVNSIQTISYDYQFLFMHNYSEYVRIKKSNVKTISFNLTKSECSIPFIPNLKKGYGAYTIKTDNNKTTMQYYQYVETDGGLRDYYLNIITKEVEDFFINFESEFKKTLNNADN